ncbi:LOW QUALITY PROTEIN: hypothetical protein ACHAWF_005037 [Thalassiosira exigua]
MAWKRILAQVIISLLLFFLVMGMASTVDFRDIREQIRNVRAISIGLFCQFMLLPLLGYLVILAFSVPPPVGITLLIVVSSPGGSYSNWWCSLLNADLALSVSMTTFSTILSVAFLPLNLFIYSYAAYGKSDTSSGEDVLESINFASIFISLGIVIGAIGTGVFCSWKFDTPRWHNQMWSTVVLSLSFGTILNVWNCHVTSSRVSYLGGNISGILLIIFSLILSFVGGTSGDDPKTHHVTTRQEGLDYLAICLPCLFGLGISTVLATFVKLKRPERLTTAVECCYQNTGIATSAALSLFSGEELKQAMRVPVVYGIVEAIAIGIYLLVFWKLGWSKAPKDEKCCKVITSTYEVRDKDEDNGENITSTGGDEENVSTARPSPSSARESENQSPKPRGEGSDDEWRDEVEVSAKKSLPESHALEADG